jgi:hypothetical protein
VQEQCPANVLALAIVTQNESDYTGPILADRVKKASVIPVVHHESGQADLGTTVLFTKWDATQSMEPKGYLKIFQEEATAQTGKAK